MSTPECCGHRLKLTGPATATILLLLFSANFPVLGQVRGGDHDLFGGPAPKNAEKSVLEEPRATDLLQPALAPRVPLAKGALTPQPEFDHRLIVKFNDELLARAVDGRVMTVAGELDLIPARQEGQPVRFGQLVDLPPETIALLESRAAIRSGVAQPDLSSMMWVDADRRDLAAIAAHLHQSEQVEWVEYEMLNPLPPSCQDPCFDIAPVTPNYESLQSYRGANPGLNMDAMWALGSGRGAGIQVADCEYWFNGDHEDLCGVIPEAGQTPSSFVIANGWHHHGSAVLGEMIGADNTYGVRGLVPEAQAWFFPESTVEGGSRRVTAIANAIATVDAGDVVLLEMQTVGEGGNNYGPAELSLAVWTVVKAGTDSGVVVVGAAGNGNQDLDSATYQAYRDRGDSGAIIVGAGSSTTAHDKLSFSTFGSRVNVQGWGQSVFSAGYGSHATIGGDQNQVYTSTFSGTSSASPFIASSCVALQSFAVDKIGRRLTPLELRSVLSATGWPQGTGGNIGRFPNLVEAALAVFHLGGTAFPARRLSVEAGTSVVGGLNEIRNSDDLRLTAASVAGVDGSGNPVRQVRMLMTAAAPAGPITRMGVRVEGYAGIAATSLRIELFNFSTGLWQSVDLRATPFPGDGLALVNAPGPASQFVQPGTRTMRARVTFANGSNPVSLGWSAFLDHFTWVVQ